MKTKVKQVDGLDERLQSSATAYTAGGTATAITLTVPGETYRAGLKLTFIASATNAASAKTINMNGLGAKNFYKPGGTLAPSITSGKAYDVWYDGTSFFLQASAEGDAVVADVLAGKTFSNDADTGLVGTMVDRAGENTTLAVTRGGQRVLFRPPAGYYDGTTALVGHTDVNDVASNIRAGVAIRGLVGTLIEGKRWASGTGTTNASGILTITGLSFVPTKIIIQATTGTASNQMGVAVTTADGMGRNGAVYVDYVSQGLALTATFGLTSTIGHANLASSTMKWIAIE